MKCLNNRRLLVVDDQEVIHFSFRTVFGSAPPEAAPADASAERYQVEYANSGEKAREIVRGGIDADEPHALAFVDMYMPDGWDGVETAARLWEVSPDLQIVICTAFTDYSWTQVISRLGKTDQLLILKKPFDKIEVRQLARGLTEKWRLAREARLNLTNLEETVSARTVALAQANAKLVEVNRDLVAARDAANAASRAKTEFLANVSHEIRTPMTSILGFADLLSEPDCPTAERIDAVAMMRRNADQLLTMIDDIIDISKLETGKLAIEPRRFAPRELALEVTSLLHVRAEEKNLRLAVEFHSAIPGTIESDPQRLRQILLHLLGNAIKFTQTGEVRLAVKVVSPGPQPAAQIAFEVIDTGVGMSQEQLQNVFESFRQADMSAKRRFRGIGLGLAVALRLARMLGGDISATSQPGTGSTFRLVLPLAAPSENGAIPSDESGYSSTGISPAVAALVD
jgi:signal transduction histidine kinase